MPPLTPLVRGQKPEQGLDGEPGLPGLNGSEGMQGSTGRMGEPGLKGEQGMQGLSGLDGQPGPTGFDGAPAKGYYFQFVLSHFVFSPSDFNTCVGSEVACLNVF